jgi:hypothetical protein
MTCDCGGWVTKSFVPMERQGAEWSALYSGLPGDAGETSVSPDAQSLHHPVVWNGEPYSFDHADSSGHECSTKEYSDNPKQLQ